MELEHRSPKSRYLRMSRKNFEKQLGNIERRQARIRRIRHKLNENDNVREIREKQPDSSNTSYHIGKTQNFAVDLASIAVKGSTEFSMKVLYYHY